MRYVERGMANPPWNAVSIHAMRSLRRPSRAADTGTRSSARSWSSTSPFIAACPHVKGGTMPDPDGVRKAGRVLCPDQGRRLVERVPQEVLAGFRLDGHEPIQVLGLQYGLQSPG